MNTLLKIFRILFVVTIASVVIFSAYFFLVKNGDETKLSFIKSSPEFTAQRDLNETDSELNNYLKELKKIKLNDISFFESSAFKGLESFKRDIPSLNSGRKNPFEPIYKATDSE